jgi:hypothetical protein
LCWLRIWIYMFLICFLWGLSRSHDSDHKFYRLAKLVWVFFGPFLIDFVFQFHPWILGWLGIKLQNLFWFAFYKVISVSWLGSRVWSVNLSCLGWFFCVLLFIDFFLNFILQHWVNWELSFIIYFNFLYMWLSWFHD